MRTAHCPMCGDLVALTDLILDGALQIREGRSEHGNPLLETQTVGRHSRTQLMADAIWRDQFINGREISLVEGFIKDNVKEGLVLHS